MSEQFISGNKNDTGITTEPSLKKTRFGQIQGPDHKYNGHSHKHHHEKCTLKKKKESR